MFQGIHIFKSDRLDHAGTGSFILIAETGQAFSQNEQPMQLPGSFNRAMASAPGSSSSLKSSTPVGQISRQTPQEMHCSSEMTGLSHCVRLIIRQVMPSAFWMACAGQILPQAPQSLHKVASMRCWLFRSPSIAFTGQIFLQVVHPEQDDVILWLIEKPPI